MIPINVKGFSPGLGLFQAWETKPLSLSSTKHFSDLD